MLHQFGVHAPAFQILRLMVLQEVLNDHSFVLSDDTAAKVAHECLRIHRKGRKRRHQEVPTTVGSTLITTVGVLVRVHPEGSLLLENF